MRLQVQGMPLSQLLSGCTCVCWPSCLVARVAVGPPVWLLVHITSDGHIWLVGLDLAASQRGAGSIGSIQPCPVV